MDPNLRILLEQCAEAGDPVEFFAMANACQTCRTLAGRQFDPRQAPDVPVAGCLNDNCRCDYLPVVD